MKIRSFLLAMMLCALCVTQASALECVSASSISLAPPQAAGLAHSAALPSPTKSYDFVGTLINAPEDYLFGQPTSDDTIYEWENPNVDRSKNTALAAPGFGSLTNYLPGSGEYLTPNLVPGALNGGLVSEQGSHGSPAQRVPWEKEEQGSVRSFARQGETELSGLCDDAGSAGANTTGGAAGSSIVPGEYPSVDTSGNFTVTQIPSSPTDIAQGSTSGGYTEMTDDLRYSDGSLGTLKIPAIGLTVKVYQGTDSAALKKGAGHFTNTSIWDGNACFAGHNRGVNNHFGKIHTLEAGDTLTLTTMLGTRTYAVTSVEKVSVNDSSGTASTTDNRVTLYTCVMNQPEYRWCVTATQQG